MTIDCTVAALLAGLLLLYLFMALLAAERF